MERKTGKKRRMSKLGGKHKLTDFVIDKFTRYYGVSLKNNIETTVQQMRDAIKSTYFHVISTDSDPPAPSLPYR